MHSYPYRTGHLDFQLAFHCAPVLAGIKPANLLSLSKVENAAAVDEITGSHRLAARGIRIYPLREDSRRILLLVYNEELLARQLDQRNTRRFLRSYGYDGGNLTHQLDRLAHRLQDCDGDFPHEIGVFLGYPLADIAGFIRHKGAGCKLSGYWKVYGDPEEAKHRFAAYDAARDFYCWRVLRGDTIHTIPSGGYAT